MLGVKTAFYAFFSREHQIFAIGLLEYTFTDFTYTFTLLDVTWLLPQRWAQKDTWKPLHMIWNTNKTKLTSSRWNKYNVETKESLTSFPKSNEVQATQATTAKSKRSFRAPISTVVICGGLLWVRQMQRSSNCAESWQSFSIYRWKCANSRQKS